MAGAGLDNNSEYGYWLAKAATSISQNDAWLLTGFGAGVGEGASNASLVNLRMEIRDVKNGGVWKPLGRDFVVTIGSTNPSRIDLHPYRLIGPNHDWRIRGQSDSSTASIFAEAEGYLMTRVN